MKPLAPSPRDAPPHHLPKSTDKGTRSLLKSSRTKGKQFFGTSTNKLDPPEMKTSPQSPQNLVSKTTTKSKKMLVIDPETQRKYPLSTDDHSLTDKELLVFHREKNKLVSPREGRSSKNNVPEASVSVLHNDQHSLSGQTLSTASALTDAEHYGGKMLGSCHVPLCAYMEGREDELTAHGMEEERDPATNSDGGAASVLSPLAALTSLASLNKIPLSPLAALQTFFPKNESAVRCKRIGMVIFPHHFGSSRSQSAYDCGLGKGGSRDGTLMGIRLKQCPSDFMAHVCYVERGSLAEKIGVKKGDIATVSYSADC